MKFLILLCCIGFAAAKTSDDLNIAVEELLATFRDGMDAVPPLKEALGLLDDNGEFDHVERKIKNGLGNSLKEVLDNIMDKIKDAVDKGESVSKELVAKLKEVMEKLKQLGLDGTEKGKEILDKMVAAVKELLGKLVSILPFGKRALTRGEVDAALKDLHPKRIARQIAEALNQKVDEGEILGHLEGVSGKAKELADILIQRIEKGETGELKDLINIILTHDPNDQRLIGSLWDKVKDFFKDLHINIKDKWGKLAEWVKSVFAAGLDKVKDKLEQIKLLGKQFVEDSKFLSLEVLLEAMEFFKPYKDDLGTLWDDIQNVVKDAFK